MTAFLYICVACKPFETSLEFSWLWMGNAAKGGMEIYTPVHMDCMCYVSQDHIQGPWYQMHPLCSRASVQHPIFGVSSFTYLDRILRHPSMVKPSNSSYFGCFTLGLMLSFRFRPRSHEIIYLLSHSNLA